MYLKKLEIHGFKSFANKTVLDFEPGITSIVGPNGSGKSNIADSLRWVFGEQSLKLLRSKKSEDVIFAGSEEKSRLGACETLIYFDNQDHKMPIAYEEVVISRRLYRNGNSEYLINGTQVRLLDIEELLLKSGFGNTSYCVIGQGMIDQLILGGSVAIKDMIEEAAGIKPYYLKRDRTWRRLERTELNLGQVRALVAEIEPRLRSLRRQTKKLERRAEIEQDLKQALILHFAQILGGLDLQLLEITSKEAVYDKQITFLMQELAVLSKDIEVEEKNLVSGSADYNKSQQVISQLYKLKQGLIEKKIKLEGEVALQRSVGDKAVNLNWSVVKNKFNTAYYRLKEIVKNSGNARLEDFQMALNELEGLFGLVWEELGQNEQGGKRLATLEKLQEELRQVDAEVQSLALKITETEKKQHEAAEAEQQRKSQLFVKDRLMRNKQETLVKTKDAKNQLSIEIARIQTRKENYEHEAEVELGQGFPEMIWDIKNQPTPVGVLEKIQNLKKQLMDIGGVDDLVQKEYEETETRYQYLTSQSSDLDKAVSDLKIVISELDEVIKKQFQEAFGKISEKFSEYFRLLFNGGKAIMSLVRAKPSPSPYPLQLGERDDGRGEEEEGVDEVRHVKEEIIGVEIRAIPPGKRLGGISALSGGERALTSIALLCALLTSYPSPFVVLDEVDAALDEANSIRFGKILGTLSNRTQFITITHNRETMRQSHTLYGVTMRDDGVSKILSLRLQEAAAYSSKN